MLSVNVAHTMSHTNDYVSTTPNNPCDGFVVVTGPAPVFLYGPHVCMFRKTCLSEETYGNHTYEWWADVNGSIASVRGMKGVVLLSQVGPSFTPSQIRMAIDADERLGSDPTTLPKKGDGSRMKNLRNQGLQGDLERTLPCIGSYSNVFLLGGVRGRSAVDGNISSAPFYCGSSMPSAVVGFRREERVTSLVHISRTFQYGKHDHFFATSDNSLRSVIRTLLLHQRQVTFHVRSRARMPYPKPCTPKKTPHPPQRLEPKNRVYAGRMPPVRARSCSTRRA